VHQKDELLYIFMHDIFSKNRNLCQKWKLWSKFEILVKIRYFAQKSKYWLKFEILVKTRHFTKNRSFAKKNRNFTKNRNLRKNQNIGQKSIFQPQIEFLVKIKNLRQIYVEKSKC